VLRVSRARGRVSQAFHHRFNDVSELIRNSCWPKPFAQVSPISLCHGCALRCYRNSARRRGYPPWRVRRSGNCVARRLGQYTKRLCDSSCCLVGRLVDPETDPPRAAPAKPSRRTATCFRPWAEGAGRNGAVKLLSPRLGTVGHARAAKDPGRRPARLRRTDVLVYSIAAPAPPSPDANPIIRTACPQDLADAPASTEADRRTIKTATVHQRRPGQRQIGIQQPPPGRVLDHLPKIPVTSNKSIGSGIRFRQAGSVEPYSAADARASADSRRTSN